MVGLMANAARHEPDAVAALRAGGDDKVNRLLRLPLPEPYLPTKLEAARDRLRTRADAAPRSKQRPEKRPEKRTARTSQPSRERVAARTKQRSGHHGGASSRRRAGAAQGHAQHGNAPVRRSRTLEGQRYG